MNVLSLCDGMSCAHIALNKVGIKVDKYFASEIKDIGIKVTQHNYPDTIQIGDVNKVSYKNGVLYWENGSEKVDIDLVCFGSPCFEQDTQVITKAGYKNIADVKVGDYVLTHTGKFQKVLATGGKIADTVTVRADCYHSPRVTLNHPYYVSKLTKKFNRATHCKEYSLSEPKWKKVEELEKGDYIGIPINTEAENIYNLTEEDCWIIGRYIADGYTRKGLRPKRKNSYYHSVILCIGKDKVSDLDNIVTYHVGLKDKNKSCLKAEIINERLHEICEKCGTNALDKHFPNFLLNLPLNLATKVLEGYMSGDGCYIKAKDLFSATTVSRTLALSLQLLVAKVYNTAARISLHHVTPTTVIEGRTVNQHDQYIISYTTTRKKQSHYVTDGKFLWLPFRKLENSCKDRKVYNLEVENDNSYTANNVIVHNCQSFSIAIPSEQRTGLENKVKSGLFYECKRVLDEVKPKYFLMENVYSMRKSDVKTVTDIMGVEPIMINGADYKPVLRKRWYWTNIPLKLEGGKRKENLNDILENGYCNLDTARSFAVIDSRPNTTPVKMFHRYYSIGFTTLIFKSKEHYEACVEDYTRQVGGKRKCTDTSKLIPSEVYNGVRYMTTKEKMYCHGIPDHYLDILTDNEASDLLGDGWQCDVIADIFRGLNENT